MLYSFTCPDRSPPSAPPIMDRNGRVSETTTSFGPDGPPTKTTRPRSMYNVPTFLRFLLVPNLPGRLVEDLGGFICLIRPYPIIRRPSISTTGVVDSSGTTHTTNAPTTCQSRIEVLTEPRVVHRPRPLLLCDHRSPLDAEHLKPLRSEELQLYPYAAGTSLGISFWSYSDNLRLVPAPDAGPPLDPPSLHFECGRTPRRPGGFQTKEPWTSSTIGSRS